MLRMQIPPAGGGKMLIKSTKRGERKKVWKVVNCRLKDKVAVWRAKADEITCIHRLGKG